MSADHQLVFTVLALCFSGFIKGWLGLGFSTISLVIIANFIEIKTAISIVLIPSLMSNLMIMFQAGYFYGSIQKFWPMLLASSISMILTKASTVSVTILGIVLILYGA